MARISSLVFGVCSVVVLVVACKDEPPPAQPIAQSQPVQSAPPPGYTTAPPATGAVPGQMATPGPTALACQNDSQCMTHHCNLQYQKCAFPCLSDADCITGTTCFVAGGPAAACLPKPPGT